MKKDLERQNILIDNSRNIIKVEGADAGTFLQNLLTNDINQKYSYSLLLTPQGKVLYDFFIYRNDDEFLLDCDKNSQKQILDIFYKYKLRQKVSFNHLPNLQVAMSFTQYDGFFPDPRHPNLGYRATIEKLPLDQQNDIQKLFRDLEMEYNNDNNLVSDYVDLYYNFVLPCFMRDYYSTEYFPFELGLEKFNAISYSKGCYIGQEVITRTKFLGVVRRQACKLNVAEYVWPGQTHGIKNGDQITCNNKKVGQVLGCYRGGILGIIRNESIDGAISINGVECYLAC